MSDNQTLPRFAVLQLSGCAGCEVTLINANEWIEKYQLVYMPLVVSTQTVPKDTKILMVSGGVRNQEDVYNLKRSAEIAEKIVAVGTCAISGGVANLGDRDDVREMFLSQANRHHLPQLLPKSRPIDAFVDVDLYLPGCPPTPELYMAALTGPEDFEASSILCIECGRKKLKDMRPEHLVGFQQGKVLPDICLINQGYLCVGSSVRGGCRAICTRPGHPCVGCRGPSDAYIEKKSQVWFERVQNVFERLTDIPPDEIYKALHSPQLSLFLFQFADYMNGDRPVRSKEKVL